MRLSSRLAAALHELDPAGDGLLQQDVDLLLRLVLDAVPSCVGVVVTVAAVPAPFTLTAAVAGDLPVRASLAVALPHRTAPGPVPGGTRLLLVASAAGAFDRLAVDVRTLLEVDPAHVAVDGDLGPLPDGAGEERDRGDVDRALGVLLDRGLLPEAGLAELGRRAAAAGTDVPAAARALLAEVVRAGPRDR